MSSSIVPLGCITMADFGRRIVGVAGVNPERAGRAWCKRHRVPVASSGVCCVAVVADIERVIEKFPRVGKSERSPGELEAAARASVQKLMLHGKPLVRRAKRIAGPKSRFPSPKFPVVYVIRACPGLIEIGRTTNLQQRLKDISGMSSAPIDVLAYYPGGAAEEREAHKRFAQHRRHGEWFEPVQEILDWAAQIGRWR